MATLQYSPQLAYNIGMKLYRLAKNLSGSGITLQGSDLSQKYLNKHDIERQTDLPWTQVEDLECSSLFAKPLDSDLIESTFESAFRDEEEKPEWPRHDVDFNGRFYTAYHLAYTLLSYTHSISWEMETPPWDRMEEGTYPFHSSRYKNSQEQWSTIDSFQATDKENPHLATLMIDGASANPELRRSELLCAITLILWSMKLDRRQEYITNPVFVYSISCCSLRILQVHYDRLKNKLVVRTTSYVDLTEEKDDIIKQCVQWMFNTPTGKTKAQARTDTGDTLSNDVGASMGSSHQQD